MPPSDARRNGYGNHKMLAVPAADRQQVTVRIRLRLYKQLEALARREKRSVSGQIELFVEQGMARAAALREDRAIKPE